MDGSQLVGLWPLYCVVWSFSACDMHATLLRWHVKLFRKTQTPAFCSIQASTSCFELKGTSNVSYILLFYVKNFA